MIILHNSLQLNIKNPIVCIGTFDGVHLGHKEIIKTLKKQANKINGKSLVITFSPPPKKVLNPESDLKFLSSLEEKIEMLEKLDIDYLLILKFTKKFSKTSPKNFIINILIDQLKIKGFVAGYDNKFGHNKSGNYQTLLKLSKTHNYKLIKVNPLRSSSDFTISSTKIKELLNEGNIAAANELLGYQYTVKGEVIHGNKMGRTLGFPTANIQVPEFKMLPAVGVYAVKILLQGESFFGMLNVGYRPTVSRQKRINIEVNIYNFNKEIYGEEIQIIFYEWIRNEKKFNTLDDLKLQLEIDKKFATKYFKRI